MTPISNAVEFERLHNTDNAHRYDAIVVGSGPGGATVARELSKRGAKVLILERGGMAPQGDGFFATASIMNTIRVGDNLVVPRAFASGGTSSTYFAVALPPPLAPFMALGFDLSDALRAAEAELPITVLPDAAIGVQAMAVKESALRLGYPWVKHPMLLDPDQCASGYERQAKWSADNYIREAIADGAVLAIRATVSKVLIERGRAIGVEYRHYTDRKRFEVHHAYAAKVVLAAGAAETPLILRASGIEVAAAHGFYCHPSCAVFGLVPGLMGKDAFVSTMGAEMGGGLALGDANLHRTFYRMLMLGNRRFLRAFLHSRSIGVGVMVRDKRSGSLRGDGRYYKTLDTADIDNLRRGEAMARDIVRNAGGKHLFVSKPSASQLGGTIGLNEDVDTDLQTATRNLYVCDGSLIPADVKVSPALTLVCFGKYLASRLSLST